MKIAIIGSGAVGRVISGLLVNDGYDVTLIAKKRKNGTSSRERLIIKDKQNYIDIQIPVVTRLDFIPDAVFFAVKMQDLEHAITENMDYLISSKIILLQNGLRASEIAAKYFELANIIRCIVLFNAKNNKGETEINGEKHLVIGSSYTKDYENVYIIGNILKKSFKVKTLNNIAAAERTKLLMNIFSNSIESVFGKALTKCINDKQILDFGILVMKEVYNLFRKTNMKIVSIPGMPVGLLHFFMNAPIPISSSAFKSIFGSKAYRNVTTSTLQSLLMKKNTEIDFLNGEILKLAQDHRINTPLNKIVVDSVHKIEKSGHFLTMNEIYREINNNVHSH